MKNKLYDILVVGSGLSSLTFVDAYLEKNKKINIISFYKSKKIMSKSNNKHVLKHLPPQMIGEEKQVKNYFYFNKILVNSKNKFFGSLEFGGLSNYWGLQIDKNILGDIAHLTKITQKKIFISFVEIFKKYNLIGKLNKTIDNSFIKNKYIDKKFYQKDKELFLDEPILGFQKKSQNKINLNEINEKKDKLTPGNLFKQNLQKKKIIFHNYFIDKIKDHKKGVLLICSDGYKKKNFLTKKLILGCGTIITTKLIMDYLKISKEIKINHHPRLLSLYISKKKWKSNMEFEPSHLHLKSKKKPFLFTADFRPGNKIIIDAIVKFKFFLAPFKFFLNFLREHLIFSSILFESKYGNLYIKKKENVYEIYSKKKNSKKLFKSTNKMIYNFLRSTKKIVPFFLSYFPGYGSDFHYFGTILMGKKGQLSVNENCQLNNNKKIYLIDGSTLNFKKNKYPLGLIMANSRRVGKEI